MGTPENHLPPVVNLGRMAYRDAYDQQRRVHAEVLGARGAAEAPPVRILLVEHDPPVITVSKRPAAREHLLASEDHLRSLGVQVEQTNRGGDITYHGPGQLVCYPIVDLERTKIRLHDYIRRLEGAIINTLADFGLPATRDQDATGVWTALDQPGATPAKIAAIGVRVERWVTLHGLALNVDPDLSHFQLIVPCGLAGRPVTSMRAELEARNKNATPTLDRVGVALVDHLRDQLLSDSADQPSSSSPSPSSSSASTSS